MVENMAIHVNGFSFYLSEAKGEATIEKGEERIVFPYWELPLVIACLTAMNDAKSSE